MTSFPTRAGPFAVKGDVMDRFTGPQIDLADMRSLGVTKIYVYCAWETNVAGAATPTAFGYQSLDDHL